MPDHIDDELPIPAEFVFQKPDRRLSATVDSASVARNATDIKAYTLPITSFN
jgi:hypothetical protein